jgi:DNA-directed RNA polymerase specialized sigma24 family protein
VKIITEIAIKHDKFFRDKAYAICKSKFDADDLVQNMYIKLYNYDDTKLKAIHEKGVLKFICVRMINQLFLDSKKKIKYEYSTNLLDLYCNNKNEIEQKELAEHIRNYFKDLYWFDSRLFDEYVSTDSTMRELSEQTGISLRSIYNAITRAKTELRKLKKHKALN